MAPVSAWGFSDLWKVDLHLPLRLNNNTDHLELLQKVESGGLTTKRLISPGIKPQHCHRITAKAFPTAQITNINIDRIQCITAAGVSHSPQLCCRLRRSALAFGVQEHIVWSATATHRTPQSCSSACEGFRHFLHNFLIYNRCLCKMVNAFVGQ